jgi:O-antigen/teichoic acid export membrane protein
MMAAGQVVGKGGYLATLLVLSRYLDDTAFGALAFAVVLGQVLFLAIDAGVSVIANRQFSVDPTHRQELLSTALGLRVAMSLGGLLVLVGAGLLAGYSRLQVGYMAAVGASMTMVAFCELFYAVFRSSEKMVWEALSRGAGGMVSIVLALAVAGLDLGRSAAVLPYLARSLLMLALSGGVLLVRFRIRLVPAFNRAHMRRLFMESLPLAVLGFLMVASQKLDNVVIRSILGVRAVGAYQECFRVVETTVLIITPTLLPGALFPALCRAFRDGWSRVRGRMMEIAQLVTGLSLLVFIPLWTVSDRMLPFLWGESFRRGLPFDEVHLVFKLVLLAIPFAFWMNFLAAGTVAVEKQRQAAWVGLAAVATSLGLNILLLPRMGLPGAGIAFLATSLLECVLFYLLIRQRGSLPLLLAVWKPLVAAVPSAAAALLLPKSPPLLRPLAALAVFLAVWVPLGGLRYLAPGRIGGQAPPADR